MRKSAIMTIIAVILAAMCVLCGTMFFRQVTDEKESKESFEEISDLVQDEPPLIEDEEGNIVIEPEGPSSLEKYVDVFNANNDFVGWISIDDTKIDYPVMQTVDEPNFYLKHAFDKTYSDYGVPYIQENCDVETCDNIVIYGHNMNNGTMFADLCKYEDEEFYKEHKIIRFDTLEDDGNYEIVAVFKTVAYSDEGFKYFQFVNAETESDFDEYIAKCKELALYDIGVNAEYGDKLITVSTCEYSRADGRIVVVAKLVDDKFIK